MRIVDVDRCYRRGRRKARDLERRKRQLSRGLDALIYGRSACPHCGQPGPHFVPPSMGERGFYICDPENHNA